MPDADVIRVLDEFRAAIDAKDEALMRDMADHWLEIERRLNTEIQMLAIEMQRRVDAGEVISEQILWRQKRYQFIKGQLDEQIARFNSEYAERTIASAQREYAGIGLQVAKDAIRSQTVRNFAMLNVDAVEAMIGFTGSGAPLGKLLRNAYPDAIDGLTRALVNGMARGLGPAQTAKDMIDGTGMGLERALLIARTETLRAYRTSATQQYRESGVVDGFMRVVKKSTACIACLMLDGERFATKDELTDHPRGKCIAVPVVAGVSAPRWQLGETWFKNLPAEQQRAKMGDEKYTLWKQGQFKLKDLAKFAHSKEWGDSPRVATINELIGGDE
jgi:SPP1 gp7 family putative phage head morphogenesis protein